MSTVTAPTASAADVQWRPRRSTFGAAFVAAVAATLTLGAAAGIASADSDDCSYSGPPAWIAAVSSGDASPNASSTGADQPTYAETALTGRAQPVADPESGCF